MKTAKREENKFVNLTYRVDRCGAAASTLLTRASRRLEDHRVQLLLVAAGRVTVVRAAVGPLAASTAHQTAAQAGARAAASDADRARLDQTGPSMRLIGNLGRDGHALLSQNALVAEHDLVRKVLVCVILGRVLEGELARRGRLPRNVHGRDGPRRARLARLLVEEHGLEALFVLFGVAGLERGRCHVAEAAVVIAERIAHRALVVTHFQSQVTDSFKQPFVRFAFVFVYQQQKKRKSNRKQKKKNTGFEKLND